MMMFDLPQTLSVAKRTYRQFAVRQSLRSATLVGAVSEFTAARIASRFRAVEKKLFVIPNAPDPDLPAPGGTQIHERLRLTRGRYFLLLSQQLPHKNTGFVITTWATHAGLADIPLVIAGRTPTAAVEGWPAVTGTGKHLVFAGHVTTAERADLFAGATAFIFPSLYEGFGIPVLEAQHYGCPVIASTAASIPEVAGAGAALTDPTSGSALAGAMMRVLVDADYAGTLRQNGFQNVQRYSWKRTGACLAQAAQRLFTTAV